MSKEKFFILVIDVKDQESKLYLILMKLILTSHVFNTNNFFVKSITAKINFLF
jgi:hypothetical protein